ncbi:MAG: IS21-like element helper ATPase IstB [Deltaproteobacteria bacterium]|nr:IS21-like element helper ATPase IstB [Deltaproteobacteria bacterium]
MKSITTTCTELKLSWIRDNFQHELAEAARHNRTNQQLLERLLSGEAEARQSKATQRKLRAARLPGMHTLDAFDWTWPTKINADHIRHLASLNFMKSYTNIVFIGTVGLGKSHLASAIGRIACLRRQNVLFESAASIVNNLIEAQSKDMLRSAMRRYTRPQLLIIDELGYLPVDRIGAELLFQVFGDRYEKTSTIITTNRPYKDWTKTFANDAVMTSAVLDRIMHHCETVVIEGPSYRMKNRIETPDES